MRKLRVLLTAATICVLVFGLAPAGSAEPALQPCPAPSSVIDGEPDQLCGTTIIRGDQSATARVRLPVDASIEGNFGAEDAQIRIEGNGGYVGIALSEIVSGRTGKTVLAYRGPGQWFGEPVVSVDHKLYEFNPNDGDEIVSAGSPSAVTLPAGLYDLYLIAEGEPVTVTLAFPGIDGESEIYPETPADVRSFYGSTPVGDVTDSLASPGIFQWVTWVEDHGAPWASAYVLRRDGERAGHAVAAGRPPAFGVRLTHTFWSTPSEWTATWGNVHGPSGRNMAHGLWLGLGDVAEPQPSNRSARTAGEPDVRATLAGEVETARQVDSEAWEVWAATRS